MLERLGRILRVLFVIHLAVGLAAVLALALTEPWVIGEGRFQGLARDVERYDFKWWLVALATAAWVLPIALALTYLSAKRAGLEAARVREYVREVLEGRSFPVVVDLDTRIPVEFTKPLRVGVKVDTEVSIDDRIEVEGVIPIVTELPLDTEITTSVFGIGAVKIPIRGRVPLNITIPVRTSMLIRASGIAIHLDEQAEIELPAIEVPIKSRIGAQIDVLSTLDSVETRVARASKVSVA